MGIELWLWSSSLADHGGSLRGNTNSPPLRLLEGSNGGISGVELNSGWPKVRAGRTVTA